MAILAVLEGELPACRIATRSARLPTTTLQFPNPTHPDPIRPGRRWRIFKLPPAAGDATADGRRSKAGRTGGMVCENVKQGSDSCSIT
jgi:hypothetical protein